MKPNQNSSLPPSAARLGLTHAPIQFRAKTLLAQEWLCIPGEDEAKCSTLDKYIEVQQVLQQGQEPRGCFVPQLKPGDSRQRDLQGPSFPYYRGLTPGGQTVTNVKNYYLK